MRFWLGGEYLIESVGCEIGSVRPEHCAVLVDLHLGEKNRIAEGFENGSEESGGQIYRPACAIGENNFQRACLNGADANDSIHFITPMGEWDLTACALARCSIIAQLFSVKFGPFEHKAKGPARKLSFDYLECSEGNFGFVFPADGVKVRRRVVVVIHSNDDSIKDAERWHFVITHQLSFAVLLAGECRSSKTN